MIIYKKKCNKNVYCYIHIPKNSGKHIRKQIKKNKDVKIIESFWNCNDKHDLAHIPFMLKNIYLTNVVEIQYYYTYVRNPYRRIISAFFYLNPNSKREDFKHFIKTKLIKMSFDTSYKKSIIHYYPQYLFICDDQFQINDVKFSKLEDNPLCRIKKYVLLDYFDPECVEIVNKIYNLDFQYFNYVQKSYRKL